jgi:hypothetical protein
MTESRGARRAAALPALAALTVLAAAYDALLVRIMWEAHMNDFGKFYYATRYLLAGGDGYAPSPATLVKVSATEARQFLDMNPPHFHLLLVPLASLQPAVALGLWFAASLASLALAVRVVVNELSLGPCDTRCAAWLGLAAATFVGTGTVCVTGQLVWLLMWPVALFWREYRRRRWATAGLLLGLLLSVKPFLVPVLALFVPGGRRRGLLACAAAGAACYAAGLAAFGLESHLAWLRALGAADWSWPVMNASMLSVLSRALSPHPMLAHAANRPELAGPFWLAASGLVLGATFVQLWLTRPSADHAVLLLLSSSLLVSPLGWVYYGWFLLPPLAALWRSGFRSRQGWLLAPAVVASFWPLAATRLGQPSPWATLVFGSVYAWGLLAFWAVVLRDCRASRLPASVKSVLS